MRLTDKLLREKEHQTLFCCDELEITENTNQRKLDVVDQKGEEKNMTLKINH